MNVDSGVADSKMVSSARNGVEGGRHLDEEVM